MVTMDMELSYTWSIDGVVSEEPSQGFDQARALQGIYFTMWENGPTGSCSRTVVRQVFQDRIRQERFHTVLAAVASVICGIKTTSCAT